MSRRARAMTANYSRLRTNGKGYDADPNGSWCSNNPYNVQPGLCVIINNTNFKNEKDIPGGGEDEHDLLKLFFMLRFEMKIHRNLTAKEMIHKAESYGKMEHKGVLFLIILSHGTLVDNREAILGIDGKPVIMSKIEGIFHTSKCPSLHGVPKIFLIDACRGDKRERVYPSPCHDTMVPRSTSQSHGDNTAPKTDSSDILLVFAATHGHVAFATHKGSQFMQTFVKVTTEASPNKSFTKIIQEVKARVQESDRGHQTVQSVDTLTRDYFIKRNILMRRIQELPSEFCTRVEEWIPFREETIQKIRTTIGNLKVHHRNVNISRITGSTVSIAGSAMAIAGFAIAPITFGASLGLSVPGIILAVAGGSTAAGASIADTVIQKSDVNQAQEQLRDDYDQLHTIHVIAKVIKSNGISDERQKCPGVGKDQLGAMLGEVLGQGFLRASNVGIKAAEIAAFNTLEIGAAAMRVGGAAAKGIAAVAIALNVVLIPVDLIEIVRSSVSLAKGSQTTAIKKLTGIVKKLEEQKQTIAVVLEKQRHARTKQAEELRQPTGEQAEEPSQPTGEQAEEPPQPTGDQAEEPSQPTGEQAEKPSQPTGEQAEEHAKMQTQE